MDNKHITILLVEDEILVAAIESQLLRKYNYTVILAVSGTQAIELVENTPEIDLILMDIDLGEGMDGTTTSRIILEKRDIPIVFLSSHIEPEVVQKTEGISSYGYVVKNSGEFVLIAAIKMAFKLYEAKRTIQEKELLLEITERLAKTGGYKWDIPSGVGSFTKGFMEIHGLSQKELTLEELVAIAHPDDLPSIWQAYTDAINNLSPFHKINRIIKNNTKEIRHVLSSAEIITNAAGQAVAIYGSCIDITENKQLQDALVEKERIYKNLFNSIKDGLIILKVIKDKDNSPVDYIIIDVNPAYEQILGVNQNERIGKSVSEIYGNAKYLELLGNLDETSEPICFKTYDKDLNKSLSISSFVIQKEIIGVLFTEILSGNE